MEINQASQTHHIYIVRIVWVERGKRSVVLAWRLVLLAPSTARIVYCTVEKHNPYATKSQM